MKALDWQRFFHDQQRVHGKTIFTVTELANVSGSSPHALNVELERLRKQRLIVRYARGRYGLPDVLTPEALLPHLDSGAYVTSAYALYRHNLITQVFHEITCFTNRRHNRSRVRVTPVGRFSFVCVKPPIYALPTEGPFASPEQALCDFVLITRRKGLVAQSQVTFRNLDRLDATALSRIASHYPATVRHSLAQIA